MGADVLTRAPSAPGADQTRAPDAAAPRQRFAHLRPLDGLRGVAVLVVVLYHFTPDLVPGGFLGVDLFFVLSGFLITSLLVSEWRATRSVSLASFWLRRARRLLPALFLLLGVVGLYQLVFASGVEAHHVGSDGLWSVLYLANWHFIATGQSYIQQFLYTTPSPLRHLWSLSIEEQFYLVWPLVVVGIGALASRGNKSERRQNRRFRAGLLCFCAVVGVASCIRMLALYSPGDDPSRVYYGTDTRVFIVLAGAVVGILSVGTPTVRRAARAAVVVAGVIAALVLGVLMLVLTTESSFLYQGGYVLLALLMVLVLVAAAQPGRNPLAVLFRWKPLVGLGLISYGVYLWHWPIGLWVDEANTGLDGVALFTVRCALTLGAALASYYLVEMPIRTGGLRRLGAVGTRLLPVAGVVAVVMLFVVPATTFPSVAAPPEPAKLTAGATDITGEYATAPRCDDAAAAESLVPHGARKPVVQLEGNSIAGEIRICLGEILAARGGRLIGVNPPGFLLCREVPAIQRQVSKTRPDAAILFVFLAYDGRCEPWQETVDTLLASWKKAGTHVFLVPSVPFIPGTPEADNLSPGPQLEAEYYRKLADEDPEHVTYVDAGRFIRDTSGGYVWRMPCLPGGEPGCDENDTVGVRYIDGLHFCTDPDFSAHGCVGAQYQGGERRAAAAVASALLPVLQARAESEREARDRSPTIPVR
jgi:peptidoglycan/LPS O-acetylase OafA/YrhL